MSLGYEIRIQGQMRQQLKGAFGKYNFEVGILQDTPHRVPQRGKPLTSLAGGPARKKGKPSDKTVAEIAADLRKKTKINYLTAPFKVKNNRDILKFGKSFFELCTGKGQKKRVENYLQAIIRNPITRGDYGRNTKLTADIKGFNRLMIDTGQFFKSIVARTVKK